MRPQRSKEMVEAHRWKKVQVLRGVSNMPQGGKGILDRSAGGKGIFGLLRGGIKFPKFSDIFFRKTKNFQRFFRKDKNFHVFGQFSNFLPKIGGVWSSLGGGGRSGESQGGSPLPPCFTYVEAIRDAIKVKIGMVNHQWPCLWVWQQPDHNASPCEGGFKP